LKAVDANTFTKEAEKSLKKRYQKADGNCFLGQERGADGGIHAARDHLSSVFCETLKKLRRAIRNERHGMLTSGVLLLHDNVQPHIAALI
jgi:hypothetical protein